MREKSLLAFAICFCAITFGLFVSEGSALEQDEASAIPFWTGQTYPPGSNGILSITFVSNSSDQLSVYYVGVHFDWMEEDKFTGLNLQDNPVNITSHGSHTFNQMIISIPSSVSTGSHEYYIGIDGIQGASENFSWDSQTYYLQIAPATSPTPTPTPTPTSNGNNVGDQLTFFLAAVGAGIAAVAVVLLLYFLMKRKRTPTQQPSEIPSEPTPPSPPTTVEQNASEGVQPSPTGNAVTRLQKLKELLEKKLITQEEYEKKKSEILAEM